MSRIKQDLRAEAELGKFLDKYLYNRIKNKEIDYSEIISKKETYIDDFHRIFEKEIQYKGIDVITTRNGQGSKIDEKATLYYINRDIGTFAFELTFKSRISKEIKLGWFLNNELETEYYLLIWPQAKHNKTEIITMDDFTELDCLLISKKSILNFLEKNELSKERLLNKTNYIRSKNEYGKIDKDNELDYYFFASDPSKYTESPINILIKRWKLIELAGSRYIVTPEKTKKIK